MDNNQQPAARSRLPKLVPTLTAGLVTGVLDVALAVSFAALVFSGPLAPFLPQGIGYALVGFIATGALITLLTSWPGFVGGSQSAPVAIVALMAAAITGLMPSTATAEEAFVTVVITIAVTTLLSGIFFLGMGYFDLGGLARFLPYPVMGGFLAGTGWLLLSGAVSLMADLPVNLGELPALLQVDVITHWLPGVLLGILIMVVLNRIDHYLVLPGMLLLAFILFFGYAWFSGTSLAELSASGWLIGPFESGGLWRPVLPADLPLVYWPALLRQATGIASVVIVSTVSVLLNASGMELAVDSDIDINKELSVAGIANGLASLFAGLVGYQQISFSVLNYKMGANNRLTGLVAVTVCGLALVIGAVFLGFFPKVIAGALLFLLGLNFIWEWVIQGWSKMPRIDYLIVLTILLATAVAGFLPAVALGLLLAVILFVVGYSQVDVVRRELSGATYHSRVVRSREEEALLRTYGEAVYLLQLQGFIFFGTADSLHKQVRRRRYDKTLPPLEAVVLDFERVSGLDTTAVISFNQMRSSAAMRNFALVFCGASKRVRQQLARGGLRERERDVLYFETLDQGLAWCEGRLLSALAGVTGVTDEASSILFMKHLRKILKAEHIDPIAGRKLGVTLQAMAGYFEELRVDAGTMVIRQGQLADDLYFLAAGQVTAHVRLPDGEVIRLQTVGSGWILGEIGFFLRQARTADVLADKPSTLFRLTRGSLIRMEEEHPQAATLLRRLVATLLAERVLHLTRVVRALER